MRRPYENKYRSAAHFGGPKEEVDRVCGGDYDPVGATFNLGQFLPKRDRARAVAKAKAKALAAKDQNAD